MLALRTAEDRGVRILAGCCVFVDVHVRECARSVGRSHAHGAVRASCGGTTGRKRRISGGQVSAVGVCVSVSVSLREAEVPTSHRWFVLIRVFNCYLSASTSSPVTTHRRTARDEKKKSSCNITAVVRPFLEKKHQNTR